MQAELTTPWGLLLLVLFIVFGVSLWLWLYFRGQNRIWEARLELVQRRLEDLSLRLTQEGFPSLQKGLEETHQELQRLSRILSGRRSGEALERALEEALSALPQDWILRDVALGPGRVEFALRLPGGYLVPVDSKFVTSGEEEIPARELRQRLKNRVTEIRKYLADPRTLGFGIAVVPEDTYAISRPLLSSLAQQSLVVVSQRELLPVLTSLYLLAKHLGLSGDMEQTHKDLSQAQEALQRAQQALAKQQNALVQLGNRREEVWRELGLIERILNNLTEKEETPRG